MNPATDRRKRSEHKRCLAVVGGSQVHVNPPLPAKVYRTRTCPKPAHHNQNNQSRETESELQSSAAMADDDDDDFFGDFKFAPTQPSFTPATTTIINSSSKTSGGDSFFDDDWGDFVTTRSNQMKTGFELFKGTNGQSPLGNSVDDESAATRGESEAPSWVKPRGALPLSLFGETEEEEEAGAGEPTVDGVPIFFRRNDGDDAKKGSGLNGGVGISDLLANLYSQSQQIKVQNGSDVNSNVNGANSNSNESDASVDGLRSNASSSNWHQNGFDSSFHDANQNSNNLGSNITVMTSNFNGFSSDLVEQSENFDNDDDEDDDGWEFKGAYADKQVGNENSD